MYTLMIVDDEPAILEGICRLLDWKQLGFERIKTAKSCFEVVSHVVDWKPDVCLVDVRIGNEFGYELINCLNAMGIHSNYIMMSGYDDFQYACEALRCGALDYLLKPLDKKQLQKRIEQVIVEKLHGTLRRDDKKDEDPVLGRPYEELSPLIRKIVMMVGMEYGQHISLKSIADRFRMNATYLGQIFIKETGMKFSEYLMAYRMHVARGQIVNTDEKISAIAADVGYSNMNYFYQHFHGFYGITPSEMRAGK
ncbi:MAG: DNA-binding response regulator [Clostridiales bacterium]|nr:MAG: DNA-binding response regulator [Clostridiales bacterium]